ncbi:MAG: LysR family transcriptional regulator [Oleibacter sp.]|nr:LysR family transcriptional regulator [Thalassolituus sp.]
MDKEIRWDDYKIALAVAESQSLSRAGKRLGINHSTVLRSVGRLEKALNVSLFIRHQRGYQLTDAGQMMLKRMRSIAGDMQRLTNTLATLDATPSGTLRISTVTDFSPFFAPLLHRFRVACPDVRVQILATDELVSLAHDDVHVAIRIGEQPQEPDLIARPLMAVSLECYASIEYVKQYGVLESVSDVNRHQWILPTGHKTQIPAIKNIIEQIDDANVVFQSNSFNDIESAIRAGMGIGPLSRMVSQQSNVQLVDVFSLNLNYEQLQRVSLPIASPVSQVWFVYHKDLKKSSRVHALLNFLMSQIDGSSPSVNNIE